MQISDLTRGGTAIAAFVVALCFGSAAPNPTLVSSAYGCSGGPSTSWSEVHVSSASELVPVDGVLRVEGDYNGYLSQAIDAIDVSVRTESGEIVPGNFLTNDAYEFWKPTEPFAPDTRYSAEIVDASGIVTGDLQPFEFRTSAGPAEGSWPTISDVTLETTVRPAFGIFVTCAVSCGSSCDDCNLDFAPSDVSEPTVVVHWDAPTGDAANPVWIQVADSETDRASDRALVFGDGEPNTASLRYPPAADRYCVSITATDVSTGAIHEYDTVCLDASEQRPSTARPPLDEALARCVAPPNDDLKPRWCELHGSPPECTTDSNATASAGSRADAGAESHPDAGAESDAESTAAGCACVLSGRQEPRLPFVAMFCALSVMASVRRRGRATALAKKRCT